MRQYHPSRYAAAGLIARHLKPPLQLGQTLCGASQRNRDKTCANKCRSSRRSRSAAGPNRNKSNSAGAIALTFSLKIQGRILPLASRS